MAFLHPLSIHNSKIFCFSLFFSVFHFYITKIILTCSNFFHLNFRTTTEFIKMCFVYIRPNLWVFLQLLNFFCGHYATNLNCFSWDGKIILFKIFLLSHVKNEKERKEIERDKDRQNGGEMQHKQKLSDLFLFVFLFWNISVQKLQGKA